MNAITPKNKTQTEQSVGTDPLFWQILNAHFGFTHDLACTRDNQLCKFGLTPSDNSLSVDWHKLEGWLYLNPPYNQIQPWAEKCWVESQLGAKVVMLVPASVGANWFRDYLWLKATVRVLNGRLTFVGHTAPYPKDLLIAIYHPRIFKNLDLWEWKKGWE